MSHRRKLPTSAKAAFACLSSRFPKNTPVTLEDIRKVEEAEESLKRHGFYQYRARHHGETCRIEIDMNDLEKFVDPDVRKQVVADIKAAGYKNVTLDLSGYEDPAMAMMNAASKSEDA